MKTYSVILKSRSGKGDYACGDGEIAGAVNLRFVNGSLVPAFGVDIAARLPGLDNSPFADGVMLRPPLPEVAFSLLKSVVEGWHIHSDMLPSKIVDAPAMGKDSTPGESDWGGKAVATLAEFDDDCRRGNLFIQPFFALTAYRLADGSHFCPSPPILMIPNSGPFMVEGSSDFSLPTMKMNVVAAACRLQWRVKMPELTEHWREKITHLDVFVSEPIALYNPKGKGKGYHRVECDNFTHCLDASGVAGEHTVHDGVIVQGWKAEEIDEALVAQAIMQTDSFHLVSEVPVKDLSSFSEFKDVKFNRGRLPILSSLETYTPDFAHLSEVAAEGCAFFSGRLTAWNLTLTPPFPLPLELTAPYCSNVTVPRWVFVPNPNAKGYAFSMEGERYVIPLRRHPNMRGSFYWGGFGKSASVDLETDDIQDNSSSSKCLNLPGGVWRSEKGNQWLFPDKLLQEMHVGEVIAVCRAFRASGLVATTSPTAYAFTTEGVFLLKEMDDGTFRDAGLICGYVLRDAGSLELLPKGVRFVTVDGEIIVIEGTKVTLSEDVEAVSEEDDSWKDFIPKEWDMEGEDFSPNGGDGFPNGRWSAFVTRPIKLSGAEDWKQLRRVALRGVFDKDKVSMAVYCSADMCCWHRIALAYRSRIDGLWSPRSRYFRIAVKAALSEGHSLQALLIIIN